MKISRTLIFIFSLLCISLIANTIHSKIKLNNLQEEITTLETDCVLLKEKVNQEYNLTPIDSLLIKGEYESALNAYEEKFLDTVINEDKDFVKFRIQIAKQFMTLEKKSNETKKQDDKVASNKEPSYKPHNYSKTSKSYDSLYNILKSTKKHLSSIKNQLANKSSFKYLKFKSSKKHILHYVGRILKGKANGYGIAVFDTGGRYEGEWKNNKREGKGVFYWADGEHYEGNYKNDLRNGTGTYFWTDGKKYTGGWKKDKRHGEGTFYDKKGKVLAKGIWKKDKLIEEQK
ncbi:MORN repeat-containing protein [Tenacibaculum amylolyticum]|uniref:MORN repeat-containing protein n=1 Tax=Tenacibaculum amylolyticum TaxID=104269 RepID=UPI003894BA77